MCVCVCVCMCVCVYTSVRVCVCAWLWMFAHALCLYTKLANCHPQIKTLFEYMRSYLSEWLNFYHPNQIVTSLRPFDRTTNLLLFKFSTDHPSNGLYFIWQGNFKLSEFFDKVSQVNSIIRWEVIWPNAEWLISYFPNCLIKYAMSVILFGERSRDWINLVL